MKPAPPVTRIHFTLSSAQYPATPPHSAPTAIHYRRYAYMAFFGRKPTLPWHAEDALAPCSATSTTTWSPQLPSDGHSLRLVPRASDCYRYRPPRLAQRHFAA